MLNIINIKTTALTVLMLFMGIPQHGQAHAVVTHSTLNVDTLAPDKTHQVYLSFNSRIELTLSRFFLVRPGDSMELLQTEYGKQPGQIMLSIPALPVGQYAIKMKIFAADGHLSQDLLHFYVKSLSEQE